MDADLRKAVEEYVLIVTAISCTVAILGGIGALRPVQVYLRKEQRWLNAILWAVIFTLAYFDLRLPSKKRVRSGDGGPEHGLTQEKPVAASPVVPIVHEQNELTQQGDSDGVLHAEYLEPKRRWFKRQ